MLVHLTLAVILLVRIWAIQGGNYQNAFPAGSLYGTHPSSIPPQDQFLYKPIETPLFQPQPFGPSDRQSDLNDMLSTNYANYIQQSDPNTLFQLQNQMIQQLMQSLQMYQSNNQPQYTPESMQQAVNMYPTQQLTGSQSSSTQFYTGSQNSNIQPFLQTESRFPVSTPVKIPDTPQLPEVLLSGSSSRDTDQMSPKDTSPISTNEIINQLQSGLNDKDLSGFSSNPSELSSLLSTLTNQNGDDYTEENPLMDRGEYRLPLETTNDNNRQNHYSKAILSSRKIN